MASRKRRQRTFEFRVNIDGTDVFAAPAARSADVDRVLEKQNALSFVFIPLARPTRKRRSVDRAATKARKKAELQAGDWHDGELRASDIEQGIPGVFAFNVRRRHARTIAESIGVDLFLWGTSGAPVEQHAVKVFDDDEKYTWKTVKRRAFFGLADLFDTVGNIKKLPMAVQESQATMHSFWRLVYVVLGTCAAVGLLHGVAIELLGTVARLVLYPVVIPAVFVGIYLRLLVRKGEAQARDFTAAETEANWRKVAPHLLALWVLCLIAVSLLTWFQSVPQADLGIIGRTGGVTNSFIVCVWMLLPIANSHDVKTMAGSAIEAATTAAISILVIRVSLYVTDQITDALWGALAALLPFAIPEALMVIVEFLIDIAAELFLMAVLLGYAWSRTRRQFMRL
ncbi:MAG: hypothetical protein AAFX58_02865 [Pseudomonadota bacterium]